MSVQKGRDLLIKVDQTCAGSYIAVAGLRARRLSFSSSSVDVTDADSPDRWRELIGGAGVRRASLSGSGIFRDADSDALVRTLFFADTIRSWQVVLPDFGIVTGPFRISALDYLGDHDGEMTFDIALESAGALSFAAA